MHKGEHRIVVGVNGSPSGVEALCWALRQAEMTGARVRAVTAWHPSGSLAVEPLPDLDAAPAPFPPMPTLRAAERDGQERELSVAGQRDEAFRLGRERRARETLGAAVRRARAETAAVGVEIEHETVEGHPADVLVDEAAGADLLVLGCRGRGRLSEIALGSVGRICARRAPCPVVIVPAGVCVERATPGSRTSASV